MPVGEPGWFPSPSLVDFFFFFLWIWPFLGKFSKEKPFKEEVEDSRNQDIFQNLQSEM